MLSDPCGVRPSSPELILACDEDDVLAKRWRDNTFSGSRDRNDQPVIDLDQSRIERCGSEQLVQNKPRKRSKEVEVAANHNVAARLHDFAGKLVAAVAAEMPKPQIALAHQHLQGRNENKQIAARTQYPKQLRQRAAVVLDMLEHID